MTRKLRYVISGLGKRTHSTYLPVFRRGTKGHHCHHLIAVVDTDCQRLEEFQSQWPASVATYQAADLADLLHSGECDWLIVAAPDHCHHVQIITALDCQVSVITEKPMVRDVNEARHILSAAQRSKAQVRVAHNFRFVNLHSKIKELLAEGAIGRVLNLRFDYHLTPGHGGSYFQRWHRRRDASGGLSITKSCHHFDLINWWLDDLPVEVSGITMRRFFHPGCPSPDGTGAIVPLDADIEDTVQANILYRCKARVFYTLNACSSWEGYRLDIHGSTGMLTTVYDRLIKDDHVILVSSNSSSDMSLVVPREDGSHSGADRRMIEMLFQHSGEGNGAVFLPDCSAGALAVAVGDAVIRSSQTGFPIRLSDIIPELYSPLFADPFSGELT